MPNLKNKKKSIQDIIIETKYSTEKSIYNEILNHKQHGDIVRESSKQLHIYKSLKSIFYPIGQKSDSLRWQPYSLHTDIVFSDENPIDLSYSLVPLGYHPIVMCSTENVIAKSGYKGGCMQQEDNLMLRTTAIYPLRSLKYRNITKKFSKSKKW